MSKDSLLGGAPGRAKVHRGSCTVSPDEARAASTLVARPTSSRRRVIPRLAPLDDGPESFIDLLPREWEVLSIIDGERNLHEIGKRLVLPEFEVAKIIYGMLSTGLIEIMPQESGMTNV